MAAGLTPRGALRRSLATKFLHRALWTLLAAFTPPELLLSDDEPRLPERLRNNKPENRRRVSFLRLSAALARWRWRQPRPPPSGAHLRKEAGVLSDDLKGKKWAVKTEGKGR